MEKRLMRLPEVLDRLGVARSTLYRLVANDPTFPKPVKVGLKVIAWRSDLLDEWIVSQEQRRAA
ncbi:MAG: AlpA family phage regulatory protein [Chloroflexota bacterium]|nr:AlpA family phage regulatory protein [Chloroflexota bacterium]